jgi:ribosomal protein S21
VVEFKRKKGESFEAFLRRFNRTLIQSRKLHEVRQRKFHQNKKNKFQQKEYALTSMKMRDKKQYLRKIGKLKDEPRRHW